jgi:hypothetical protein
LWVVGKQHRIDERIGSHVVLLLLGSHSIHRHRLTASTHPGHSLLRSKLVPDSTLGLPLKIVLGQFSVGTASDRPSGATEVGSWRKQRDGSTTALGDSRIVHLLGSGLQRSLINTGLGKLRVDCHDDLLVHIAASRLHWSRLHRWRRHHVEPSLPVQRSSARDPATALHRPAEETLVHRLTASLTPILGSSGQLALHEAAERSWRRIVKPILHRSAYRIRRRNSTRTETGSTTSSDLVRKLASSSELRIQRLNWLLVWGV